MNLVDYVLIGIVVISILVGLYRGFITSLLGLAAVFAAMFAAYALGPRLADVICSNETVVHTLAYYSDTASRIGNLEISQTNVAGLDAAAIARIVALVRLPRPFDALLESNLAGQVFAAAGSITVSDYVNQTVLTGIITVICYVAVFLAGFIALSVIFSLIGYVFRFPTLKHLDTFLGGVFGLLRGVFLGYILFALVPVLLTIVPVGNLEEYIQASRLGNILYHSNIVTTIFQGIL